MTDQSNQSKPVHAEWTRGIKDPEEKKKLQNAVRHDTLVLGVLLEILDRWEQELDETQRSQGQFDNPNWPYKTAFDFGDRSRLQKVRNLLSFLTQ